MATTPYIPSKDADFSNWLANFATLIAAHPTTYGLVSGDATAISAQNTTFQAAYTLATDPTTRTSVTVAAKDAARATAESVIRPYAVQVSLNSGVSNDDKTAVGVTVKKTVPTPVPPPTTVPVLALIASTHLVHQLSYRDTSTPTSKSKPPGVISMQLVRSLGTAPAVDPDAATFYDLWTKSPNNSLFQSGDVMKLCTYWGRWVTRGGPGGSSQYGPWSTSLVVAVG